MKHFFLRFTILLMILPSLQSVGQEIFEIKIIKNAESITIGKKAKRVGDSFNSKDEIIFPNDSASFIAIKKGTTVVKQFSKASMDAKKAKTVNGYFANDYAKVKGSSRGGYGNKAPISYGTRDTKKFPEKRIALVIGNSNYEKEDHLLNAVNDARDVSQKLKNLGFDVITLYDADIDDMQTTISSFFDLAKSYQVALIYFAGHGVRYAGKDYLLSTDRKELSVSDECSLEDLVDESEKWKSDNSVMIFVIDACRSSMGFNSKNEYKSIEARKGTFILQSTSSGEAALDTDENASNSPFATAFIECIGNTGGDIEEDFITVRQQVRKKTNDTQIPRTSMGGGYDFHFCLSCDVNINLRKDITTDSKNSKSFASFEACQEAAQKGDTLAQYLLGNYYYHRQQYEDAFQWYKKAANKNHIPSIYGMGICYLYGTGVDKSAEEGVYWIRQAAEHGMAIAQNELAYCYSIGHGVSKSYSKAVEWYTKSANQGYARAKGSLGYCYEAGLGIDKSYKKAARLYEEAAESNIAEAQYRLGRLYFYGNGVEQSYDKAAYWYEKSAQYGNIKAINDLGWCYEKGYGKTQSDEEAARLYRLAASKYGSDQGQYNLGRCYYYGIGVGQSYNEAIRWFSLAAEQSNANAQYALGFIYYTGEAGTPQSYSEAVKWFKKAADNGDVDAQYNLGLCYELGRGINKSRQNAIYWYKEAAKQEHKEAQKKLKIMRVPYNK